MKLLLILLLALFSGPDKCAQLTLGLSTDTTFPSSEIPVLQPGSSVAVIQRVTNCGTKKASFAVDAEVVACGQSVVIWQSDPADGQLDPGATFVQSAYYQIDGTCTERHTVVSKVRSGQQLLNLQTRSFDIE